MIESRLQWLPSGWLKSTTALLICLFRHNRSASANALARPLVEAGVRTVWLAEDPSLQEICAIAKGRESVIPLLGELNSRLSKRSEIMLGGRFRGLRDSLTHGGARAMAAQFLGGDELEGASA